MIYRIDNSHLRTLVQDAIYHAEHAGPGVPAHHETTRETAPLPAAGTSS